MLLWQLKNARNRYVLWLKLLACSLAAHLLFVGILFFGYRDGVSSHKFTMHNHSLNTQIMVVLAPTARTSPANGTQTKRVTSAQSIKPMQQNKVATSIATLKPTAKAAPAKKTVLPKKGIAKATPVKTAPAKPKPVKTVQAKIEKPKVVPPKPDVAKTLSNKPKELVEQKKSTTESPIVASAVATASNSAKPTLNEIADRPNNPQTPQELCANDSPTHIEIPYTQAREFYQQEALRKELSRHWTPPHGIPDTCSCEITTYVGNNGVVTDCVITQSSGILMYDVSARAAILAMELPRWTWGDSFAITFKP